MNKKKKMVLIIVIALPIVLIILFYNSVYLKKIGHMADTGDGYAYINGKKFKSCGATETKLSSYQCDKRPIGRVGRHPAYSLGESGESTAYLVRDLNDRGRPHIYYDVSKYPNGFSKDGVSTLQMKK